MGPIRRLRRLEGAELAGFLGGRPLVGVDGTLNTFGGAFPHYLDLMRAIAKPSTGEPLVLKTMHCPLPPGDLTDEVVAVQKDHELRQQKLATLEAQVALEAARSLRPAILLMDGPLVRFDMRTKNTFSILQRDVLDGKIMLAGCIENIESRVIPTMMEEATPPGWQNRYDRDILWGVLEMGEVLEVRRPVKGLSAIPEDRASLAPQGIAARKTGAAKPGEPEPTPVRTWFMRTATDPGVTGLEMLEAQADQMGALADYLYTITPPDGRGMPLWLDIVDREVRLTDVELSAYLDLLDPQWKRVFMTKRSARIF
ncbi:MAG TPA: DNA double-strand break repair nuclease NurA [Symbiobacteriaceae bacterium]|nr:DNA double-strand break repair nuclease NurA [Symbiobacteriaceae bacterium]